MRVRGPYYHEPSKQWRIQVVKDDGTATDIYKKTKPEALAAKVQALAMIRSTGGAKPVRIRAPDGTMKWYSDALDKATKRVLSNPDDSTMVVLVRTVCQAVVAKKACQDQEDLERRIVEAENYVKQIRSARRHGTGTQGETEGYHDDPVAEESLSDDGAPLSRVEPFGTDN